MTRITAVLIASSLALTSSHCAFATPIPGDDGWHFSMSKAIATELADTPAWSLASPYLRELSPKTQDWNLLLLQAKVDLQRGDVASAQSVIQRALEQNPGNPRIQAMAGTIAFDAGNYDEAIQFLEKANQMQPRNTAPLLTLARIRFARQEWQAVIDIYERILSQIAPTSEIYVRLSTAYENLANLERAEHYLKENLSVHPNRLLALLPLERFYQRHNQPTKASDIARERASLQKKDADPRTLRSLQKSSR